MPAGPLPNVIVLGCGRSGTSIFGELFEALPQYTYLFEPSLSDLAGADYLSGPVATKGPRRSDAGGHSNGLPFVLADLYDIVPAPRLIYWVVRNPLDCISSLRPGILEDWSHVPRPDNWRQLLREAPVMRCAAHWTNINIAGFGQVADVARVIKYEVLIGNPLALASQILADLGLAEDLASLQASQGWAARVNDLPGTDEAARQTYWMTRDHSVHVGRWRENLAPSEVESVRHLVAEPARRFGYVL